MKPPEACTSKDDIRAAIDQLDRDIVALLGRRAAYVRAIVQFKTSEEDVRAEERFQAVLRQRRQWAQEEGLNPDVIEQMYRILVEHFIQEEMTDLRKRTE
jgi:isochorismate pyruvate lyase